MKLKVKAAVALPEGRQARAGRRRKAKSAEGDEISQDVHPGHAERKKRITRVIETETAQKTTEKDAAQSILDQAEVRTADPSAGKGKRRRQ